VPELPLGICLDTAHAFHAGYAIHTEEGLEATIAALERTVGLRRAAVLHVNDSKTPFGSRVDRHEHIGKGGIGLEGMRRVLNHPKLSANGATRGRPGAGRTGSGDDSSQVIGSGNRTSSLGRYQCPGRAFLLETPIDKPGDDRRNVRRLWKLVGIDVKQAPKSEDGFRGRRKRKKDISLRSG
jgi:hypothetical protein